jgi:dTDP-4-dehydrorhamnose reductase
MKILVVGSRGMLGTDVVSEFQSRGHQVITPSLEELDIADPTSVAGATQSLNANWCINCSGYTAVDLAESEEQLAAEINALGPGYLARACGMAGTKLVHISTDFVFDGSSKTPYTEDDRPNPLSVYGRTKLAGEEAVSAALPNSLIFRTSWLFGLNGKSFPRTILNAWRAGKSLRVVSDQVGNPTHTKELARTIADSAEKDVFPGIYHATGPETMSWFDFAKLAIEVCQEVDGKSGEIDISPVDSDEWPTPAVRPKFSALSNSKLLAQGIPPMCPVRESLENFVSGLE